MHGDLQARAPSRSGGVVAADELLLGNALVDVFEECF
jgi:hypothetical protein